MKSYGYNHPRFFVASILVFLILLTGIAFAASDVSSTNSTDKDASSRMVWVCDHCSAVLNDQEGFSSDLELWECTYCHSILVPNRDEINAFDPETAFEGARYPGWYWYCDRCEAFLNIQKGFDDHLDTWTCTECGYESPITDAELYKTPEQFLSSKGRAYTADWYNFLITPRIYESDAKFSFINAGEKNVMTFGDYTLGKLVAYGDSVNASTSYKNRAAFGIDSLDFTFGYEYSGKLLEKSETNWSIASCKDKTVDAIKLDKTVGNGCIIVQTSPDGVDYETVVSISNLFSDYPEGINDIYKLSPEEVLSGTFFKVIIAYQTQKKISESNVLFIRNDNYDYRYHVEVYDFYIGYDYPSVGLRSIVVKENNVGIIPILYESSKDYHYEDSASSNKFVFGHKSLGNYAIGGQFTKVDALSDVTNITTSSRDVLFSYRYSGLLDGDESVWELTEDKGRKIGDTDLGAKIGTGAILIQHSFDGKKWENDYIVTDAFNEHPSDLCSYLCTLDEDMEKGVYFRTIVAYQTRRKTDTSKILFLNKDNYEYLKQVEVYPSYIKTDGTTRSTDIWDSDNAASLCGFQIDKMGTRYDVSVNGEMAKDGQKYVTNGEYTIVVSTPLGKTDSRTITVDKGYDSLGAMLEESDDISVLTSEPVIQVHHFDNVTPVNTGKDNGFAESNKINTEDPHFGWTLGHFTISGFSYKKKDQNGEWIFYKVPGDSSEEYDDNIVLQFDLKQNIDILDGDTSKYICSDTERKDQDFQYQGIPFGRGTLLVRHEKYDGQIGETQQYADYLDAKGVVNANTEISINEEGRYQITLDYEIASKGTFNGVLYNNYKISFVFNVLNGNCTVYAFDVDSGAELENGSTTESGFKLDLAKSHYLTVSVKREKIVDGVNGLTLNTCFNGFAKEGVEYTEPGLYTITASIPSTGHQTNKVIYVGDPDEYEEYLSNKADSGEEGK